MLAQDAPEVVQLCHLHEIDPKLALCGARIDWDGAMEWEKRKSKGATAILVPVADPEHPQQGRLLRNIEATQIPSVVGRYLIQDDELTFITEHETIYSVERLWFESPNFRVRHSLLKRSDGISITSFCTEIRLISAPPAQS
jgi:hypothetical protein